MLNLSSGIECAGDTLTRRSLRNCNSVLPLEVSPPEVCAGFVAPCNEIHRSSRLSANEVDHVVEQYVARVGPSYGRRTLTGLLRSEGIIVGERVRVNEAYNSSVH